MSFIPEVVSKSDIAFLDHCADAFAGQQVVPASYVEVAFPYVYSLFIALFELRSRPLSCLSMESQLAFGSAFSDACPHVCAFVAHDEIKFETLRGQRLAQALAFGIGRHASFGCDWGHDGALGAANSAGFGLLDCMVQ